MKRNLNEIKVSFQLFQLEQVWDSACLKVSLQASPSPLDDPCLCYLLADLDLLWFPPNNQTFVLNDQIPALKLAQCPIRHALMHCEVGNYTLYPLKKPTYFNTN